MKIDSKSYEDIEAYLSEIAKLQNSARNILSDLLKKDMVEDGKYVPSKGLFKDVFDKEFNDSLYHACYIKVGSGNERRRILVTMLYGRINSDVNKGIVYKNGLLNTARDYIWKGTKMIETLFHDAIGCDGHIDENSPLVRSIITKYNAIRQSCGVPDEYRDDTINIIFSHLIDGSLLDGVESGKCMNRISGFISYNGSTAGCVELAQTYNLKRVVIEEKGGHKKTPSFIPEASFDSLLEHSGDDERTDCSSLLIDKKSDFAERASSVNDEALLYAADMVYDATRKYCEEAGFTKQEFEEFVYYKAQDTNLRRDVFDAMGRIINNHKVRIINNALSFIRKKPESIDATPAYEKCVSVLEKGAKAPNTVIWMLLYESATASATV